MKVTYRILATFILAVILSINLQAQKKVDHVLRKYKNDSGVVALDLSGDFSSMLSNKELLSKIDKLNIMVFSDDEDISEKDRVRLKKSLQSNGYEKLMNAKSKDGSVKLFVIEEEEYITHLYAEMKGMGKRIFLTLEGEVIYDELRQFDFDFEGSEIFKEFKN